jgi:hypothetical protein
MNHGLPISQVNATLATQVWPGPNGEPQLHLSLGIRPEIHPGTEAPRYRLGVGLSSDPYSEQWTDQRLKLAENARVREVLANDPHEFIEFRQQLPLADQPQYLTVLLRDEFSGDKSLFVRTIDTKQLLAEGQRSTLLLGQALEEIDDGDAPTSFDLRGFRMLPPASPFLSRNELVHALIELEGDPTRLAAHAPQFEFLQDGEPVQGWKLTGRDAFPKQIRGSIRYHYVFDLRQAPAGNYTLRAKHPASGETLAIKPFVLDDLTLLSEAHGLATRKFAAFGGVHKGENLQSLLVWKRRLFRLEELHHFLQHGDVADLGLFLGPDHVATHIDQSAVAAVGLHCL